MKPFASPEDRSAERPIQAAAQLIVEGRTPEMFFRELVKALQLEERIDVRTFGDISHKNLSTWMEIFVKKSEFKNKVRRLGIVRDAETVGDKDTAAAAFASVCSVLREVEFPVPPKAGEVTDTSPLAVGIYVLPDCLNPGNLESLCWDVVCGLETNHPHRLSACIHEFFACSENGTGRVSGERSSKEKLAAWILAHGVSDPQLGRAAQRGVIPFGAPLLRPLSEFLVRLAGSQ